MSDIIYYLAWVMFIPAGIILFFLVFGALVFIGGIMLDVRGEKRDSKNNPLHIPRDR